MELRDVYVPTVLGRLRVRVAGTGPAMVFWPSLLMDSALWTAQAEYFSGTRQVLLLDPPGHGGSTPLSREFTFAECAECVVQVLDQLDLDRVDFVGNSWGGMVGGTFAARHPARAGVSVLMNCTASPAGLRQRIEYALLTRLPGCSAGCGRRWCPRCCGRSWGPPRCGTGRTR